MSPAQIINHMASFGWVKDCFGHLQKKVNNKEYRLKIQANSCRLEVRIPVGEHKEWMRLEGDYLRNILIQQDGRLRLGKYLLGVPRKNETTTNKDG